MTKDNTLELSQQPNSFEKDVLQNSINRAKEIEELTAFKKLSHPLPLSREKLPEATFPFEALGNQLGSAAQRMHEIIQAPKSICGSSVLGAIALCAQPFVNVLLDGRCIPTSLFLLTVGESGDRKSSVDNVASKPIQEHQKKLLSLYTRDAQIYKNNLEIWNKKRKSILNQTNLAEIETNLQNLEEEPTPPLKPIILMEEPTYEGLVKLFQVGQPSVGLFSDEGGRMFGGFSMDKQNLLKTACGLSSLWDGKPITRIRGEEAIILYGKRFSTHLMIQEIVLENILNNPILMTQGLLARCLVVYPVTLAGQRSYQELDPYQDEAIQAYHSQMAQILDVPLPLQGASKNILNPRNLELSSPAKRFWKRFHDDVEKLLSENQNYFSERRSATKTAEQALRIAGTLTIFNDINAASINVEEIDRGIALAKFYLDEAIRIFSSHIRDPNLMLAEQVLNWMKRESKLKKILFFPLTLIYQKGPIQIRDAKTTRGIMKILQEHDLVIFCPNEKINGVIKREVWTLNEEALDSATC